MGVVPPLIPAVKASFTVIFSVTINGEHVPSIAVNVRVAVPVNPDGGDQVAISGVPPPLFVNVPPASDVQTADVTSPPNDPRKISVAPP
jgi:hypothetical protein